MDIGSTAMSREELMKNCEAAFDAITKNVKGGLKNIRSIHLKKEQSLAVPVYLSFGKR